MTLALGVAREVLPGERRVALVPEVAAKFRAAGARLVLQRGAGAAAGFADEAYGEADWMGTAEAVYEAADLLLCVAPPDPALIARLRAGSVIAGFLQPYAGGDRLTRLRDGHLTSFPVELVPRISRAQSMDALSSQASVSGYQCVLIAAGLCPKFFPMLTTAAGTVRPAKVLVIGAGVAGLQAIATARRLGAVVEAYDVRSAAREQAESLGARWVDTGVSADGAGGYARELTDAEKEQQRARLAKAVAQADVLITTAAIPGRRAPRIVDEAMVRGMKRGAVIVDMAADSGGNCAFAEPGREVEVDGVTIAGPVNLPARLPVHASEMLARNFANFFLPFLRDGALTLDWADEVLAGTVLTRDGAVVHRGVRQALKLDPAP